MKERRTLVLGNHSTKMAATLPVLERRGLEVDRVSSPESALELAKHRRFHLALVDYPLPGIAVKELTQGLVGARVADHRTYVVLVATPETIEEARGFVGHGADAVLSTTALDEESTQLVHGILGAPARVGMRVPVRPDLSLEEESSLVFRQTEDLSATGMLVRTPSALPVGTEGSFRLDLPRARSPIEGRAQVVRHVLDADGRTVRAMGMRFLSFKGDDQARLQSYVDSAGRSKS